MSKLVHFGAGNIGKALVFPIFKLNKFDITFVDDNKKVVNSLKQKNYFNIHSFETNSKTKYEGFDILHLEQEKEVIAKMLEADVITTSIGVNNLKYLKRMFSKFIETKNSKKVNVICIENGINVSSKFKKILKPFKNDNINFVDCVADKICVQANKNDIHKVYAEDLFNISLNSRQWSGKYLSSIKYYDDLEPIAFRKLWILNSTHSLLAWLIWGEHSNIFDIVKNKRKEKIVNDYMDLAVNVTLEKFPSFSKEELAEYKDSIYKRFINKNIIDCPFRVGRNFKTKVGENERFITLYKAAKNKAKISFFIKMLYKLNKNKQIDKEIYQYYKKHNLIKTIEKFSNIKIKI